MFHRNFGMFLMIETTSLMEISNEQY